MQACLCGCLTDLVSKTEVGQKVNRSRMEQIEKEWLSNHPNHFSFFFLHYSPVHAPAVLFLWASQEVLEGECLGRRQGEVTVLLAPGMGG